MNRSKTSRTKNWIPAFAGMTVVFCLSAFAGGPMIPDSVTRSGQPARWPKVGEKYVIKWKADGGTLKEGLSRSQALSEWVLPLFQRWETQTVLPVEGERNPVLTTAIDFAQEGNGNVGDDITATNYQKYLEPDIARASGPAIIIFDIDGSIIEDYVVSHGGAPGAKNQIAGMGLPLTDGSSKVINGGVIILNGRLINGVNNSSNDPELDDPELQPDEFKGVILHEIGHLLNLDHSAVNQESATACDPRGVCNNMQDIPTMWPQLKSAEQYGLHRDDIVTVSWLYPSKAFDEKFCKAAGAVKNEKNGKAMAGVHIVAKNTASPTQDARGMVSGVLYPNAVRSPNGDYILAGLSPKIDYQVEYEELPSGDEFSGSSNFEPLNTPPTGFGSDAVATIRCESGGQMINVPAIAISISDSGNGSGAGASDIPPASQSTGSSKGWCQLILAHPDLVEGLTSNASFRTFNNHALEIFGIFNLFVLFVWRFGAREKSLSRFIPRSR